MDRFYNEDPENEKPFFGNDDDDDDDDDFYEESIFIRPDFTSYQDFKKELLDRAIKMAESSWFWRFKSAQKKAFDVSVIYKTLELMVSDDIDDDDDEDILKDNIDLSDE